MIPDRQTVKVFKNWGSANISWQTHDSPGCIILKAAVVCQGFSLLIHTSKALQLSSLDMTNALTTLCRILKGTRLLIWLITLQMEIAHNHGAVDLHEQVPVKVNSQVPTPVYNRDLSITKCDGDTFY